MKILGTIVNNRLTWEENCSQLIKKVNTRMAIVRNAKAFGATIKEMVHLWITFCRGTIEQTCVLWHKSLTEENSHDLERVQKTFAKLALGQKYNNYEAALIKLNLLMVTPLMAHQLRDGRALMLQTCYLYQILIQLISILLWKKKH